MFLKFRSLLVIALTLALRDAASAQVAESYTLTDITGWTSNQLAALPWFAHWIPQAPPGAPPNFSPAARNGAGAVVREAAGYYPTPDRGAVVENGTATYIPAWGKHYWSYWTSGPGATALVNVTRQGNLETVTVRTDFPGTQPGQFLRLRVQTTAP